MTSPFPGNTPATRDSPHNIASNFDDLRAFVCLSLCRGIGPQLFRRLLEHFNTPQAILQAAFSSLREVPGVGPELAREIVAASSSVNVNAELEHCRRNNIHPITQYDSRYPKLLAEIHDPPTVLYTRGELQPEDSLAIAVVGTRHATRYGLRQATRLAHSLAKSGITVVSGLARGIDAAAHRGALEAGGRTIAVLAHGLLDVYPSEHKQLADEISIRGALLSESPPSVPIQRGAFPRRNRIISGLSLGTVVVEAAPRSGALISARLAMEQGREVFAVPGNIDERTSRGCHALIRDGAKLVEDVNDILEELGPLVSPIPTSNGDVIHHPAELQLNDQERKILQSIDANPTSIDAVVAETELPTQRVLATLIVLETRHLIHRVSGNLVARM